MEIGCLRMGEQYFGLEWGKMVVRDVRAGFGWPHVTLYSR